MTTFLAAFILLLLVGSFFSLGFHTITRGERKKLPDGSEYEEKEIFGAWQIFWEDILFYNKVYYRDEQLEMKLKILEQLKPAYMNEISFSTKEKRSLFFNTPPTDAEVRDIEWTLNCHVFKNDEVIFLYEEIPVHRFSAWVRKITNCHVCLSGWMGTIIFFTAIHFYPELFSSNAKIFISWVAYCISLAFVNSSIKEFFSNKQINS